VGAEKQPHARIAQRNTDDGPSAGEEDAFGQKLANYSCPRSANGSTDSKLTTTARGTEQQQIGNVGARHEQHQAHRARQDEEQSTVATNQIVAECADGEPVIRGKVAGKPCAKSGS